MGLKINKVSNEVSEKLYNIYIDYLKYEYYDKNRHERNGG